MDQCKLALNVQVTYARKIMVLLYTSVKKTYIEWYISLSCGLKAIHSHSELLKLSYFTRKL